MGSAALVRCDGGPWGYRVLFRKLNFFFSDDRPAVGVELIAVKEKAINKGSL